MLIRLQILVGCTVALLLPAIARSQSAGDYFDPFPQLCGPESSFESFAAGPGHTDPWGINVGGEITGDYYDSSNPTVSQGFVRDAGGYLEIFHVAGAVSTYAVAINLRSEITGYYTANDPVFIHGFIRQRDGKITTFDINGLATTPTGLNAQGEVVGSVGEQGFVRSPNGQVTTFNFPGALGTMARAVNDQGAITGFYNNSVGTYGFIRSPYGAFTSFDLGVVDPSAAYPEPVAINDLGQVSGWYTHEVPSRPEGFIRDARGLLSVVTVPNTTDGQPQATYIQTANNDGYLGGDYVDANNVYHAFTRDPLGRITKFDAPGANGKTIVSGISDLGEVTGSYAGSDLYDRGFVCTFHSR